VRLSLKTNLRCGGGNSEDKKLATVRHDVGAAMRKKVID
jgi:hypothetical protein